MAPAKHSILDSVHKCIKYTARGSGSSASDPFFWLSPTLSRFSLRDSSLFFGFSNILAVFSLYNTCNVTEIKRKCNVQIRVKISHYKLMHINIDEYNVFNRQTIFKIFEREIDKNSTFWVFTKQNIILFITKLKFFIILIVKQIFLN